jgi:uncharacterized membrane protein
MTARPAWLAPVGLILLSLIPVLAGAARLTELVGNPIATASNERFVTSPIPVVVHIVSVTIYSLLGAFQFVPALRRRSWHRRVGRVLVPAGFLAALSGLWMVVSYGTPFAYDEIVSAFRLVFGTAMVLSILLGIRSLRRRDYTEHSEWMTRAYAIALGAGTQALILIPVSIIFGTAHNLVGALFMGAAWIINLTVAQRIIVRRRTTPTGKLA